MSEKLRIATCNLENLDEMPSDESGPTLEARIEVMRLQLRRLLDADALCLQEVNAQEEADEVGYERPILRATVELGGGKTLSVINLHLKSRIPTPIEVQKKDFYT
ncbi:hypothetical protein [Rubrobacter aplysinae]|uniref:hypothetical protein n=1 Tax=Rubrobacter aplysinae TaxID=909625 RepID=UPI00069CF23E|nr:hypothetical protein [Rubrobacter aplysinae]